MKSVFYALIVLGLIAAIMAVFIAFNARDQAVTQMADAQREAALAVQVKQTAEREKADALLKKENAERLTGQADEARKKAEDEISRANDRARESEARGKSAEEAANKRVIEAEDMKVKAQAQVLAANTARDEAVIKQKEAEGQADVEKGLKEQANDKRDKTLVMLDGVRKDYEMIRQLSRQQIAVATFVNDIINRVIVSLDSGDQNYLKGLTDWNERQDIGVKERTIVLGHFIKAREFYNSSLSSLNKMEKVSDSTEEARMVVRNAITNDIGSIDIVIDILRRIAKGETIANDILEEKTKEAVNRKLTADATIIDACKSVINLINSNGDPVTPTIKAKLDELKKQYEERIGPEKSGENASLTEQKFF